MREIKFRGKCSQSKRWVYGWLLTNKLGTYIVTEENPHECTQNHYIEIDEYCRVIPETVGQYTGFKDKNGTKIFDGDICNCREYECFGKIKWNKDNASFYFLVVMEGGGFEEERLYEYADELAVIGNIHDNPELLGGAG